MLNELMEEYHKELAQDSYNWDAIDNAIEKLFPHAKYGQRSLTPADDLVLIKDFLQEKEPSLDEVKFISSLSIGEYHRGRIFTQKDAKAVIEAYKICAKVLSNSADVENEKKQLVKNIDGFINNHIETKKAALDIYDKYLFDVDGAIIGISSCMENQPRLLERGFAVMHKAADARCKQEELDRRKNPDKYKYDGCRDAKYAATYNLESAFRGLYSCYSAPQLEQYWDKITENLMTFDEQMRRFQFSNILSLGYNYMCTEVLSAKRRVLWLSLDEAEKNEDISLREIYQKKKDENYQAEWFLQAEKCDKAVQENIKSSKAKIADEKPFDFSDMDFVYVGEERPTLEKFEDVSNFSVYGSHKYTPSKPVGGLWTSPVKSNGRSDWENWLDETLEYDDKSNKEAFCLQSKGNNRYHIVPKEGCRILYANKVAKFIEYMQRQSDGRIVEIAGIPQINYERMFKDYDAIFVPERWGDFDCVFRGWSVETLLIGNFRKFEVMDDKEYEQYKAKKFEETVEKASKGDKLTFKKAGKTDFNRRFIRALKDRKIKQ